MARRVVLHVGPRKTATTYLQRILQALVVDQQIEPSIYPITTRDRTDHNQVPGLIDLARIYTQYQAQLQNLGWTDLEGLSAVALDGLSLAAGTSGSSASRMRASAAFAWSSMPAS